MPLYLVERFLRDLTSDQLRGFALLARRAAEEASRLGSPVRYLRSTFVPGEKRCFCLYEGVSAAAVRRANEMADLPLERVIEATQVSAEDLRESSAGG
jgi:hypothetical protein